MKATRSIAVAVVLLAAGCSIMPEDSPVDHVTEVKPPPPTEPPGERRHAKPEITREERMKRSGEAARMKKWGNRLAGETARAELERELETRRAELGARNRMMTSSETIDHREARLAMRNRLRELHDEVVAMQLPAASDTDVPRPTVDGYDLAPAELLAEVERLSKEQARLKHLKVRKSKAELCERALDAALAAEEADAE